MPETKVYRLFQLCESISNVLSKATANKSFWVSAEIVRVNERRGHRYLELVDMEEEEELARMSAVLWSSNWKILESKYGNDIQQIFESGKKVLLLCSINYHPLYGLKLIISNVDLDYTIGNLEMRKRRTLEKIRKEGLLDLNRQIPLPPVIKNIIVISSSQAAGYEDMVKHLEHNAYNYGFNLQLIESSVQGVSAEGELCSALAKAQEYDADVIAIIRGGGSRLDLEVFNSYSIAHAIAYSRLPVITGVGHESDETVVDLVAHSRQKTPTAVAHFFIEQNTNFESTVQWTYERIQKESRLNIKQAQEKMAVLFERIHRVISERLSKEQNNLSHLNQSIFNESRHALIDNKQKLKESSRDLSHLVNQPLRTELNQLDRFRDKLKDHKDDILEDEELLLIDLKKNLKKGVEKKLREDDRKLEHFQSMTKLFHPENVLRKGFALVKKNKQVITRFSQFTKGDQVDVEFYNFSIKVKVEERRTKENGKKNS